MKDDEVDTWKDAYDILCEKQVTYLYQYDQYDYIFISYIPSSLYLIKLLNLSKLHFLLS